MCSMCNASTDSKGCSTMAFTSLGKKPFITTPEPFLRAPGLEQIASGHLPSTRQHLTAHKTPYPSRYISQSTKSPSQCARNLLPGTPNRSPTATKVENGFESESSCECFFSDACLSMHSCKTEDNNYHDGTTSTSVRVAWRSQPMPQPQPLRMRRVTSPATHMGHLVQGHK